MRIYPLILLAAFFSVAVLSAQSSPEPMSVSFSCISWSGNIFDLSYQKGQDVMPIRVTSDFRSEQYSYMGPNPIVFFREVMGPEGILIKQPIASASIPNGMTHALLIFNKLESPDSAGREYRILVIDDGSTNFPWGSFRVFNFSEHQIGGIIADEKFVIQPKSFQTISPKYDDDKNMGVRFSINFEGEWIPAMSTRWRYHDTGRNLVFLTTETTNIKPHLEAKIISQYLNGR